MLAIRRFSRGYVGGNRAARYRERGARRGFWKESRRAKMSFQQLLKLRLQGGIPGRRCPERRPARPSCLLHGQLEGVYLRSSGSFRSSCCGRHRGLHSPVRRLPEKPISDSKYFLSFSDKATSGRTPNRAGPSERIPQRLGYLRVSHPREIAQLDDLRLVRDSRASAANASSTARTVSSASWVARVTCSKSTR